MVNYVIKQFNNSHSAYNGQFYAKAVMVGEVGKAELAEEISQMCTVNKVDVTAVLEALVPVMRRALLNSMKVKLEGFGSFKVGLKSSLAPTIDKFSVAHNIYGSRVVFQPEYTREQDGAHKNDFTKGLKLKQYVNYGQNESLGGGE